jgi:hypothetical protein
LAPCAVENDSPQQRSALRHTPAPLVGVVHGFSVQHITDAGSFYISVSTVSKQFTIVQPNPFTMLTSQPVVPHAADETSLDPAHCAVCKQLFKPFF